jgi:hypothetical protein
MALRTLRRLLQRTRPAELRTPWHLAAGDSLKAAAVEQGMRRTPVRVVAWQQAREGVGTGRDRGQATWPPHHNRPQEQEESALISTDERLRPPRANRWFPSARRAAAGPLETATVPP